MVRKRSDNREARVSGLRIPKPSAGGKPLSGHLSQELRPVSSDQTSDGGWWLACRLSKHPFRHLSIPIPEDVPVHSIGDEPLPIVSPLGGEVGQCRIDRFHMAAEFDAPEEWWCPGDIMVITVAEGYDAVAMLVGPEVLIKLFRNGEGHGPKRILADYDGRARRAEESQNASPSDLDSFSWVPRILEPYDEWPTRRLIDPRQATIRTVARGLLEIVSVEGPVLGWRVYHTYLRASGGQRLTDGVLSALNDALALAVETEEIWAEAEWANRGLAWHTLRLPNQPRQKVRQKGPRQVRHIPPGEVAELGRLIKQAEPYLGKEAVKRRLLQAYGLQRLGRRVSVFLDHCLGY